MNRRHLFRALRFAFMAMLLMTMTVSPSFAAGVVGDGTPASCTEAALDTALAGGGSVTFNCGVDPMTIVVTGEKVVTADTTLAGGSLITISGGNTTRIFKVKS